MITLWFLFFFEVSVNTILGADWCYLSQVSCNSTCPGPDEWTSHSNSCGLGLQSPINVVTRKALSDERLAQFQFTGYQETFHGHIKNNGHTVQVSLPASVMIKGGNLSGSYKAIQFHLHWGKEGGPGSEHTLDGERYPMEMHIVHIKEEYKDLDEALGDRTGVAVLAFFFQESKSPNKKYDPIINVLKDIKHPSSNATLNSVSLDMLLPHNSNRTRYYRYSGSLTTPSCAEAVVWTLFENPISLSRAQLAAFSQLKFSDGKPMVETYRPGQPLNGRKVYYSGAPVALFSTMLVMTSVVTSLGVSLPAMS